MSEDLYGYAITAIGGIAVAWLGLRGTRSSTATEGLKGAAQWWQEAVNRLDRVVGELRVEVATLTEENRKMSLELMMLQRVLMRVYHKIAANADAERAGSAHTQPHSNTELLIDLLEVVQEQKEDDEG